MLGVLFLFSSLCLVRSEPWPGLDKVHDVDPENYFTENLSGLEFQPATSKTPAIMWGVRNKPSSMFKLIFNGTYWLSDSSNYWQSSKKLTFPDGTGAPDSEDLTRTEWDIEEVYVCSERNGSGSSRLSILRYVDSFSSSTISATHEWILNSDLPSVEPNLGLEAITYLPDKTLMSFGFYDENKNTLYDPNNYPNHGSGLFCVGLEGMP